MTARLLVLGALLAVAAVLAGVLLRDSSEYEVHARFENAGLLVEGGDVQVAGRKVGKVGAITLADDGSADVVLRVKDRGITPLHAGTRASIRALAQAGVANRVVDLSPGSARTAALDDGAILPLTQTTGIVNIDQLLNTFEPRTRTAVQRLIRSGGEVYAGSGADAFNAMLAKLAPALADVRGMTGELAADGAQLDRLIQTAQTAATTVAERRPDLVSAIDSSARWLTALANERKDVAALLADAPATLAAGRRTLAGADSTVQELRPVLRELPATTPPLRRVLRRLTRTLPQAEPVVARLGDRLPAVRTTLDGFGPLDRPLRRLLASTSTTLQDAMPILGPLREYTPDLVLGVVNGLAGVAVGNYNASGHYARLEFVQSPQTLLGGQLADLLSSQPLLPGAFEQKVRQLRRCPGGALPPAADGSNANLLGEPLCDPSQSMSPDVNRP